ncbi:MAG: 4Fe-4S dicluster domain-containing protein [Candidatus Margulisiibacteriota bacterium]
MKTQFISQEKVTDLARRLAGNGTVVGPVEFRGQNILAEITADNAGQLNLAGYRTVEPLKSYLFRLIEKVGRYFGGEEEILGTGVWVLGARGCDLEALDVLDRVNLEGEFCDPLYKARRAQIGFIGVDCTACAKTCFCTMVGGQPYPTRNYDLSLSPVAGGYVAEARTERGEELVVANATLFRAAREEELNEHAGSRRRMELRLEQNNLDHKLRLNLSDIHKINLENKVWKKLTKDCVECSACNFICPTCTCFLLIDSEAGPTTADYSRHKVWDACLKNGYARVAGGANSRPKLYERLQNRYHCKFDYSYDRLGRYTCVGCGRCIDSCAGNIDMRLIFKELERQAPLTAKLV